MPKYNVWRRVPREERHVIDFDGTAHELWMNWYAGKLVLNNPIDTFAVDGEDSIVDVRDIAEENDA